MLRLKSNGRSRGVVLVIVLVLFMALSGLTLMTIEISSRGAVEASRVRSEYEAHFKAEEAVFLIYEMLRDDNTPFSDTVREKWSGNWKNDGLEINITPCNSKLNLPAFLRIADQQTVLQVMGRVLPPGSDVQMLLSSLAVWGGNNKFSKLAKMDNLYYATQFPSYSRRKGAIKCPEELLLIRGWGEFDRSWINETFTVWGMPKMNLNYISRELLLALFPKLSRKMGQIVHWRETRGFTDLSQLLSVTGVQSDSELYKNMQKLLTVRTDSFEATVKATVSGCTVVKRYIISRPSTFEVGEPVLSYQNDVSVTFSDEQ